MNKIKEAFAGKKAIIPYITCGDPNLTTTAAAIRAAAANGASMIALGIPFSDPTAEGPLLQESSLRALYGGVTTDKVFEFVKAIRAEVNVPFVFVTYANVVFSYGSERFISTCRAVGVDGLMVQDLPFEERYEFLNECHAYHVELIHQITTSSEARIEMIAKGAEGMVCVSVMANDGEDYPHMCGRLAHVTERIKACTDVPCIICYNCAEPHEAKMMADISDGLLIATQSVEALATLGENAPEKIGADIAVVRKAID